MVDYQSEKEIEAVVKGFELCTTAKEDFKHRNHLTVAVWYLSNSSLPEAFEKVRDGLFKFLDHHGVGREKYHETLTIFWLKLVHGVMAEVSSPTDLVETTNTVVDRLADTRVVFEYYSEELLWSDEAKRNWIEPDLKAVFRVPPSGGPFPSCFWECKRKTA